MSTMRYIKIPPPVALVPVAGKEPIQYDIFQHNDDSVWPAAIWRRDESYAAAFNRLTDAFDEAKAKRLPVVAMSNEDFEKYAPLATLKDQVLNPLNARAITKLTQAVTFASSVEPDGGKIGGDS